MTNTDAHSTTHRPMARPPFKTILWSVLSAGLGIWALAALAQVMFIEFDAPLMIGAFGASAALLFGVPNSPLAQPYNLVVGHILSALIGVSAFQIVGESNVMSMALAVSLSIGAMQLTRSVHPPGGATALIAVIGSEQIHDLGYYYVLSPVGIGVAVLLAVAFVTNNIARQNRWPVFWLPFSGASVQHTDAPRAPVDTR